jgi:hypothetical protein
MKKTLRKYQIGTPSYTGFSSGLSTTPKLTVPTFSSNPAISQPTRYTSQFSETPEKPASNVGGTVASAASGIAGSVMSGISTANSAQANIDAAKRAKKARDEAKRNIAAFRSENINNPDAVREYTQMQNSTYNREDASLDVGRMQSEAQEEISKNTTIAATSAIPIVGPLISGLTALTWGLMGDAEEEQYQDSLNRRKTKTYNNVGGTSEESRPDSMFAKYGGKMDMMKYGKGGLYANIHAKRERIEAGSGETMRSPGDSGAPTAQAFKDSAETAKMGMGGMIKYGKGGYTVTRSDDNKGKTHKVTGPDGSVKYFGDPNMGERSESKYGKEAFYARHKSNLENNPHFRAYARATWENGGIYIDPAKKGTFKAQATRMDMGVQEAASKILSASEGEYSPEMRRKANFARNFAKRDGGMIEYKKGGMHYSDGVQIKNANAELEGDEIIMKNGGKRDVKVNGPSHEQGGVPMKLESGDFVWSDHLKYKGRSMAELYLMVKNSPEKVNQLKDLQEDLASKEKPSKYNDLPQKKYGGELPKYQRGTPYRPYELPIPEQTTPSPGFPLTRPQYNIFGKYPGGGTGMIDVATDRATVVQANAVAAAQALQAEKAAKTAKAAAKAKITANLAAAKAANVSPTLMPAISGQQPLPNSLLATLPTQSGPALTVANVQSSKGRAPGTYSKARTLFNEYGRYIPQVAGSLAQIGMLAGMKDPYENLTVPQAARVANSQFTALGRVNNQAAEDQIREMYQAQLTDARYRGAGPGDASQGQMAYNRAVQAIAETQRGVMNTNVNLAAQEANMNMEDKQRREVFNAAAINARNENINANRVASANFNIQKSGALAGAFGTMGTDISKSIADKEVALAIYGNTSMNSDRYGINNKEVERLAKEAALKNAKAAGRSSATPQEELLEMVKLYDAMKTT